MNKKMEKKSTKGKGQSRYCERNTQTGTFLFFVTALPVAERSAQKVLRLSTPSGTRFLVDKHPFGDVVAKQSVARSLSEVVHVVRAKLLV
jgi:hypothetical protein